jgi:hypothetical protein
VRERIFIDEPKVFGVKYEGAALPEHVSKLFAFTKKIGKRLKRLCLQQQLT